MVSETNEFKLEGGCTVVCDLNTEICSYQLRWQSHDHSNAQTANSSSSTFSKCNGLRVIYPVVKTFSWRFTANIYHRHLKSRNNCPMSGHKRRHHFYPPRGNCFWNLCIDTPLSNCSNETHFVFCNNLRCNCKGNNSVSGTKNIDSMSQHRQEMTSAQMRIIVHNIAADWIEAGTCQGIHWFQGAKRSARIKKPRPGIIGKKIKV